MRVLVTGADGFVGQHVIERLLSRGHDVVGGIAQPRPLLTTLAESTAVRVAWRRFDLQEPRSVEALVREAVPEAVLHLAALSSVSRSWRDPARTFEVNAHGVIQLLMALRDLPPGSRRRPVVLVGSGEAYGENGTEDAPLKEDHPLRPRNPYAASKAAQEMLGWALGRVEGIRLVQTRSFQQTGPGQSDVFVTVDWAMQLLAIRDGGRAPRVRVGNIDLVRDFLDVRDAADAYIALLDTEDAAGVFNVCSGRGISLRTLFDMLQETVGVSVDVQVDPERLRPTEITSFIGDPSRLMAATGWSPRHDLRATLRDVVAHLEANPATAT